ncbi:MAG: hypothetical protein EB059_01755 [Alphaproteobacteria bacterium]|nr:hypothetical protein [Alphaproteobacteria bacterium]
MNAGFGAMRLENPLAQFSHAAAFVSETASTATEWLRAAAETTLEAREQFVLDNSRRFGLWLDLLAARAEAGLHPKRPKRRPVHSDDEPLYHALTA